MTAGTVRLPPSRGLAAAWSDSGGSAHVADAEALVEGLRCFDRNLLGQPAHRDRELVEESDLPDEDGPCRTPVMREPDLTLPLEKHVVVFDVGCLQAQSHICEPDLHGLATDPKIDLTVTLAEIDPDRVGEPWRSENVLAPRVDQGQRGWGYIRCHKRDWHDRS